MSTTISAGTYVYTDCVVCPPTNPGDPTTFTSVEPPHPIYTNDQLTENIVQIQAVALGGFNGLNN